MPVWLRQQPSARKLTVKDFCRPIRTVEEQTLFHELYPLHCNERGSLNAAAMTADWNVQVGLSCANYQPQQIFMKSAHHLLLYAKQLVTELNARDSRIVMESAYQQSNESNFRVQHYEQVPVPVLNRNSPLPASAAAQQMLQGVPQSKGRGGPNKAKMCTMCGEPTSQGGSGGKKRGVGVHDCRFCRYCFEELGLRKGDPTIPLKASCKHCQNCSSRGRKFKVVLKANCQCRQLAAAFLAPSAVE